MTCYYLPCSKLSALLSCTVEIIIRADPCPFPRPPLVILRSRRRSPAPHPSRSSSSSSPPHSSAISSPPFLHGLLVLPRSIPSPDPVATPPSSLPPLLTTSHVPSPARVPSVPSDLPAFVSGKLTPSPPPPLPLLSSLTTSVLCLPFGILASQTRTHPPLLLACRDRPDPQHRPLRVWPARSG